VLSLRLAPDLAGSSPSRANRCRSSQSALMLAMPCRGRPLTIRPDVLHSESSSPRVRHHRRGELCGLAHLRFGMRNVAREPCPRLRALFLSLLPRTWPAAAVLGLPVGRHVKQSVGTDRVHSELGGTVWRLFGRVVAPAAGERVGFGGRFGPRTCFCRGRRLVRNGVARFSTGGYRVLVAGAGPRLWACASTCQPPFMCCSTRCPYAVWAAENWRCALSSDFQI